MPEKRAIIIGHRGQDGQLLSDLLEQRNYHIVGIGRSGVESRDGSFQLPDARIEDAQAIAQLVRVYQPDEIYYLAAHHVSAEAAAAADIAADVDAGYRVNVRGLSHVLQAMQLGAPRARLFYASSSLIFGNRSPDEKQDETTTPTPAGNYALFKLLGSELCKEYRQKHGLFASVGILYSHESHLRGPQFVSRKIIDAAVRISQGSQEALVLGDLQSVVDWGFAPDYVDAFTRIVALPEAEDFIIATGHPHTVRDFVSEAFDYLDLNWQKYVKTDRGVLSRSQSGRIGNPKKLMTKTHWQPSVTFNEMIQYLVNRALLSQGQ